ncbi:MAG: DUF5719 family protein [Euzebya sp.]
MTAGIASDRARGRKRGIALLLSAVLIAAASIAASQLTSAGQLTVAPLQSVDAATSGTAYCPIIATDTDTAQLEIASASLSQDSDIVITRFVDGEPVTGDTRLLEAGRSAVLDVPAEERAHPVSIDWRGGAVVAQYRLVDDTEQAVATCQTRPSDRWFLSGFDTNRGNTSTLHLFNPFGQDAVVRLRFGENAGPVDLVIADEITIPAGQVVVRDLAEFRPETADLAVTVTAQVGRVVPQGQITFGPAGEGLEAVTGRALLPATAVASEQLFIPDAISDDITQSWVTVYNPSDRPAAVQVGVSTPLGTAAELSSELTVPAGSTARVDLADLSALPRLGIRLDSVNGIGLVATRTTAISNADRTGVALESAVPMTDQNWAVPGGRSPDASVTLYNPGADVATANVQVAGGTPQTWTAVTVPPNALTELSLEGLAVEGAALVQSDLPLVAGVVSLSPETATAFWSASGVAQSSLVGGDDAIAVRRDPGLLSVPAVSATATPTPVPLPPGPGGEGQLDPSPSPSIIAEPSVTPTAAEGVTPAPIGTASEQPSGAPDESSGPTPLPPATTEEGSLFGKVRRGGRQDLSRRS